MRPIQFTSIDGIRVGHAEDLEAATGCTVVISEAGAPAGRRSPSFSWENLSFTVNQSSAALSIVSKARSRMIETRHRIRDQRCNVPYPKLSMHELSSWHRYLCQENKNKPKDKSRYACQQC
jgi:hypothetical protein